METNFSKRTWTFLWICLILLNVIIRIPITPHEIGHDSFLLHFIADSLSTYGHAKWWLNPLSMIGLYPHSEASALPFYLSGISQVLSLVMENAIWVALLLLGVFSSFTAYFMAGAIKDDKFFKFITAFIYSTAPGILVFTTWSASGRGMFLVLLPLFIYFLIKSRFSIKYGIMAVVFWILLLATHNLVYLTGPIILGFCIALVISKVQVKSSNLYGGIILLILFIIFLIQLSVKHFSLFNLILSFVRYTGVLIVFTIGGFVYLLFKKNRTFEENFLILALLFLTPIMSVVLYSKYFMIPFEALLASYGIMNLIKISRTKKHIILLIILFFSLSVGVAEFYQFGRTNADYENSATPFYAEDSIVNAALWTKSYTTEMMMTDEFLVSRRMLAYSGANLITENNIATLIQGNLWSFNISNRSPFSTLFYSEGPYQIENPKGMTDWLWYKLRDQGYYGSWKEVIFNRFDIYYYIRDERYATGFSITFDGKSGKLYDNGKNTIWYLKNI
ncbi:Uncharacterised protein [uncultured archaeon]|nr:Uncharacterised protein [uncultured archaeon]